MAEQQGHLCCTITWFEDKTSGRGYFLAKFDDGGRHEIPEEICGGGPIHAGSNSLDIAEAVAADLGLELLAAEHDGQYIHADMRQPGGPRHD